LLKQVADMVLGGVAVLLQEIQPRRGNAAVRGNTEVGCLYGNSYMWSKRVRPRQGA
jgi:hypothetical protein